MDYTQFVKHVNRNGWSIPELRCDVRPTNELLHFIETVGPEYEAFLIRYLTIQTKAIHTPARLSSDPSPR
jgi:hypothetical protein